MNAVSLSPNAFDVGMPRFILCLSSSSSDDDDDEKKNDKVEIKNEKTYNLPSSLLHHMNQLTADLQYYAIATTAVASALVVTASAPALAFVSAPAPVVALVSVVAPTITTTVVVFKNNGIELDLTLPPTDLASLQIDLFGDVYFSPHVSSQNKLFPSQPSPPRVVFASFNACFNLPSPPFPLTANMIQYLLRNETTDITPVRPKRK